MNICTDEFKENLLKFFRCDDKMSILRNSDRYEIVMACLSHSEYLTHETNLLIDSYELNGGDF
jgi:hypothetical protein